MKIFFLLLGLFLTIFFIILVVLKSKCKTKIIGTFIRYNYYPGNVYVTGYAPIFKYTFNNIEYVRQTFQTIFGKKIKQFEPNKQYEIYINSNNPKIFVVNKKIELSNILLLILGIIFITFSILITIK